MSATTLHDQQALQRVRRDFPLWTITYHPDGPAWRRWTARRIRPLTDVEIADQRRREITTPTLQQLLGDLGAEQRAQDILRSVTRG